MRAPRPAAGKPPDQAALHEAALRHLARYSATEAGLRRVLERRIDRWARAAAETHDPDDIARHLADARAAAKAEAAKLVAAGLVDDAAYAAARARGLARAGRSRRAIAAHLAVRGVSRETAAGALPEEGGELAAAVALTRRRRIGAFRQSGAEDAAPDPVRHRREQAMLARAGFSQSVAREALRMDRDAAEALIVAARAP